MKNLTKILFLIAASFVCAQPELSLVPNNIEFKDKFDRLENVLLINTGDQDLVIDTIRYNNNFYFVRFDEEWKYPITILPNDTLKMDCLLSNYFLVTSQDTTDIMKVLYSGYSDSEDIGVRIGLYNDDDIYGIATGTVSDESGGIQKAKLYFYYDGNYLFDTTRTDLNGTFTKQLPEGNYTIAAEKEDYYFSFYGNQFDPYNANKIFVPRDSTKVLNFNLIKKMQSQNGVKGKIIDALTRKPVRKAIIVVRKGKHTPTKLSAKAAILSNQIKSYTVNVKYDGTFSVDDIIVPGYYYIQAFSDFYLPSYTSDSGDPAFFWQDADSILIQNSVIDKNIILKRDSSYGGGTISGSVGVSSYDSLTVSDVIIFAKNIDYNDLTYFTIPNNNGTFQINNLPYGKYQLIAQSIGFEDAVSSTTFDITPTLTNFENVDLKFIITSISESSLIVTNFRLHQNYPNPFNPTTTISYQIPDQVRNDKPDVTLSGAEESLVQLKIYDVLGKEVATLVNKIQAPGNYQVEFDASNIASGIYLYRLNVNGLVQIKKMVLLR